MIHMSREKALKILNEPNGPEKLAAKAEQAFEPAWALYIKENNAAAGVLRMKEPPHYKNNDGSRKNSAKLWRISFAARMKTLASAPCFYLTTLSLGKTLRG